MAFIKTCTGTVAKCTACGKPGIFNVSGKMYCEGCKASAKDQSKN